MIRKVIIALLFLWSTLYACVKEDPVLPQESLYFDEIIDAFSVFDRCDTIEAPKYQLARAINAQTEIRRLFYLQQPNSELVFLGRSAKDTAFQDNSGLYFHGLSVADQQLEEPVFILSEDEVDLELFAVDNIYLIGKASTFGSRYLFLSSSDALAATTSGAADLFKVRLYEIEATQDTIIFNHKLQLNATSSSDGMITYAFESRLLPNKQEVQVIQEAIAKIKTGSYSFDPTKQVKNFDQQLGLYQRDFRFAEGLLQDTSFSKLLSEENQEVLNVLNQIVTQESIAAFFCLADQKKWTSSNNLAPNISTPLD